MEGQIGFLGDSVVLTVVLNLEAHRSDLGSCHLSGDCDVRPGLRITCREHSVWRKPESDAEAACWRPRDLLTSQRGGWSHTRLPGLLLCHATILERAGSLAQTQPSLAESSVKVIDLRALGAV